MLAIHSSLTAYKDSTSIILLQLGVVLYAGNQFISNLLIRTHLALFQLGVILSAGNQLIRKLLIKTHLALSCLLAINLLVSCS
jgi:hypothetical protein